MNIKIEPSKNLKELLIKEPVTSLDNEKGSEQQIELSRDCIYSYMKLLTLRDIRCGVIKILIQTRASFIN